MGGDIESEGREVVTTDDEVIGTVGQMLWRDTTGFDIVVVDLAGADVVVPVRHGSLARAESVVAVGFSADEVRQAPTVGRLAAQGGEAAVRLVAEHYELSLAGPPPGPETGTLPPWWTRPPQPPPSSRRPARKAATRGQHPLPTKAAAPRPPARKSARRKADGEER